MPSLPKPPGTLTAVGSDLRSAIVAALASDVSVPEAWAWAEKLRRFAGVYRPNLMRVAGERFGAERTAMLRWMTETLLAASDRSPRRGSQPCDPSYLNAALAVIDAAPALKREQAHLQKTIEAQIDALRLWHDAGKTQPRLPLAGPSIEFQPGRWKRESAAAPKIVVFCPNPFSLLTLSILEIFRRLSVPVAGVVIRKFTLQRFTHEFRRDGGRLIYKVWRKLIVRGDENPDDSHVSLKTLAEAGLTAQRSAPRWCAQQRIPVFKTADLNDVSLRAWLRQQNPDIGVFTGGGLVDPDTQSAFRIGIINPHMGHLPHYRGMDVVQWPVLDGRMDNIGLTAHLMDAGLDTGAVIQYASVDPAPFRSLGALRNAVAGLMPLLLTDAALGLGSGRLQPIAQKAIEPLHYHLDDRLHRIVEARLRDGSTRAVDGGDTCALFDRFLAEISASMR